MYNLLRRRLSFAADRLRSTIGHAEFDKLLVEGSAMSDEALMVEALKEPERSTA
jgi:hypothetical protein